MKKNTDINVTQKLSLSDELALERTSLANERTFLAFLRTGLALIIAGASIMELSNVQWFLLVGMASIPIGGLVVILGFIRFFRVRKILRAATDRKPDPALPFH